MSTDAAAAPKRKKHRIYESKGEPYFQAFLVIFFALMMTFQERKQQLLQLML